MFTKTYIFFFGSVLLCIAMIYFTTSWRNAQHFHVYLFGLLFAVVQVVFQLSEIEIEIESERE